MNTNKKELSPQRCDELLKTLKGRFEKNRDRHKDLEWAKIQAKLEANAKHLWSLDEMELSGGEPDVVDYDKKTGKYTFYDCSAESPKGAEASVTTAQHWIQGKNINRMITLSIWLLLWVLNF